MNADLHNAFQQNQIYYTDALVLIVSYGLTHCSYVMVTMVAPRFSMRRSRRRDHGAASK